MMHLMKEINEAAYKGGGKGTIEWIVKTFFYLDDEGLSILYKLKPGLIAIHHGRLIEFIEVDTQYEREVWLHPLNEEPFKLHEADKLGDLEIYQAKKIN
ncbi:hypothetical protein LCGC14_2162870 [marine sediment metagenome]|uniref:Uncharacterized protein n=1 Tax=marine sediment metagenome TaxID=412755 RepID=A0A0F9DS52_9ZZZZ